MSTLFVTYKGKVLVASNELKPIVYWLNRLIKDEMEKLTQAYTCLDSVNPDSKYLQAVTLSSRELEQLTVVRNIVFDSWQSGECGEFKDVTLPSEYLQNDYKIYLKDLTL